MVFPRIEVKEGHYSSLFFSVVLGALLQGSIYAAENADNVPLEAFRLSDTNYKIELWAHSPMLFNPTGMDVDARGNVWVSESLNYRKFIKSNEKNAEFEKGDRISVLSDTDGDGKADRSHVFVQDAELIAPLGVAVLDNKIFVSCSPSMIVYTDVNRNLHFDEGDSKEIFLTGFGGKDHDHSLHKMELGPDGRFYINAGNAGPHLVKDKSGWELRANSWYGNGRDKSRASEVMKSTDGRIYTGGVMLSIREDGKDMKILGHNFRNPYGHSLDSFGSIWMNDNDDTESCRTTWIMRHANLGYSSKDGLETWQAGKRPGQSTRRAHWRQDDPGVIPSGHVYGNASPTGMVYHEVGDGLLLSCEAGQNVIWGYKRQPKGAGFELQGFPFLSSTGIQDPNYNWKDLPKEVSKWFRPSDIVVGTDGSIFISDWFDPTVGGHRQNETAGKGAIYRISRKEKAPSKPSYDFSTLEGAVIALDTPAVNVRYLSRQGILHHGDRENSAARLKQDFSQQSAFVQARRIWLLAELGDTDFVYEVMRTDPSSDLKQAAFRALEQNGSDIVKLASEAAKVDDSGLRREALLSLRDVPFDDCKAVILDLVSHFDGADRWYLEAIGTALERKEEQFYTLIRRDLREWDDKHAAIAWRLHPDIAADDFKVRAGDSGLSDDQRKQAIDALAFITTEKAAMILLEVLGGCDGSLREYCLWWLNNRKRNNWKTYLTNIDLSQLDAGKLALESLKKSFISDPSEENLRKLLATKEGTKVLLQMAMDKVLPNSQVEAVTKALLNSEDKEINGLANTYLVKSDKTYKPENILAMKGDAERGKTLFYGKAICFSCHKIGGHGGELGPELTAIKTKFDQSALLDAIINPSAAILVGYESIAVTLTNGTQIQGTLLSDEEPMIIKNAIGERVEIPKQEIKQKTISKNSIMPTASSVGLNEQDLADLLTYLNSIRM
jgi:putative membrane-bound dehydrogenase-like protein